MASRSPSPSHWPGYTLDAYGYFSGGRCAAEASTKITFECMFTQLWQSEHNLSMSLSPHSRSVFTALVSFRGNRARPTGHSV